MAHDGGGSRSRRRGAVVLAGLLAGFASAALLNAASAPRSAPQTSVRATI